jgi:hypothetical protein
VRLGGALRVVPVASACFVLEVVIVRYRGIDLHDLSRRGTGLSLPGRGWRWRLVTPVHSRDPCPRVEGGEADVEPVAPLAFATAGEAIAPPLGKADPASGSILKPDRETTVLISLTCRHWRHDDPVADHYVADKATAHYPAGLLRTRKRDPGYRRQGAYTWWVRAWRLPKAAPRQVLGNAETPRPSRARGFPVDGLPRRIVSPRERRREAGHHAP